MVRRAARHLVRLRRTWRETGAAVVFAVLVVAALAPGTASAAVAEFFWAGFQVSDPRVDGAKYQGFLSKKLDPLFRSRRKGAVAPLLGSLAWDEFAYFETAADTGYVKENMRDVYGVFISIDRIMRFKPSVVEIAGRKVEKHYTYIFATLNVFAADSRNLIYSHPFFLTDVFDKPMAVERILEVTLGKFAAQLKEGTNPFIQKIARGLQNYFGPPGVSLEAIRRTKKPIHPIDGYFTDTFGVMEMCDECVAVLDKSGMAPPDTVKMGDFARFFLNSRLAEFRQVAFLPEQSQIVEQRTGDAASAAKEGDVKRDFSVMCLAEYDETGKSRICVKVAPPKNPVWIGVRGLVKPEKGAGTLVKLRYATIVDIEAELAGKPDPIISDVSVNYKVPAVSGQRVSDVYYINALVKAINKLDGKQLQ
jgi:hypothetical protein